MSHRIDNLFRRREGTVLDTMQVSSDRSDQADRWPSSYRAGPWIMVTTDGFRLIAHVIGSELTARTTPRPWRCDTLSKPQALVPPPPPPTRRSQIPLPENNGRNGCQIITNSVKPASVPPTHGKGVVFTKCINVMRKERELNLHMKQTCSTSVKIFVENALEDESNRNNQKLLGYTLQQAPNHSILFRSCLVLNAAVSYLGLVGGVAVSYLGLVGGVAVSYLGLVGGVAVPYLGLVGVVAVPYIGLVGGVTVSYLGLVGGVAVSYLGLIGGVAVSYLGLVGGVAVSYLGLVGRVAVSYPGLVGGVAVSYLGLVGGVAVSYLDLGWRGSCVLPWLGWRDSCVLPWPGWWGSCVLPWPGWWGSCVLP